MPNDATPTRPSKSGMFVVRLAPEVVAATEALAAKLDVPMVVACGVRSSPLWRRSETRR